MSTFNGTGGDSRNNIFIVFRDVDKKLIHVAIDEKEKLPESARYPRMVKCRWKKDAIPLYRKLPLTPTNSPIKKTI